MPRTEITGGIEGRYDHSRYENWQDVDRVRDAAQERDANQQLSGALFVQSMTELGPRVRLSLGARYDALRTRRTPVDSASVSASHGVATPKLGLLVKLTPAVSVYGNASRGFRSPDNINVFPELDFITAWSYEAGIKADRTSSSVSVALFQMDVSDEQQFSEVCACSVSGGASRRRGVDFSADARLAGALTITTDWTLNDAKYRSFETEDGDVLADRVRVFNTARYVGMAAATLSPKGSIWTVRLATNVVGPYTPFDEEVGFELPAYALLHLSGRVRLSKAEVELGVRNLLDRNYPELRAGGFVAPGQPRSLIASLRYVF